MSEDRFLRSARVTLSHPPVGVFLIQLPNAMVVEDLRIQFSIEKSLAATPNKCEVQITNLSRASRTEFRRQPTHVQIEAGYVTAPLKRLFVGDVLPNGVSSARKGADWVTKIQLADGGRAFAGARVSKAFGPGTNSKEMLREAAASMGLKMPTSVNDFKALLSQTATGETMHGPSSREMTRILGRHDLGWSIQDNQLQIHGPDTVRSDEALVIDPDIIVGSPEYGAPSKPGDQPILKFKARLIPELLPGTKISLDSEQVKGVFRVEKLTHTGDTFGDDWTTEIEAKSV